MPSSGYNFNTDRETHAIAKTAAGRRGVSLVELVRDAVRQYLGAPAWTGPTPRRTLPVPAPALPAEEPPEDAALDEDADSEPTISPALPPLEQRPATTAAPASPTSAPVPPPPASPAQAPGRPRILIDLEEDAPRSRGDIQELVTAAVARHEPRLREEHIAQTKRPAPPHEVVLRDREKRKPVRLAVDRPRDARALITPRPVGNVRWDF